MIKRILSSILVLCVSVTIFSAAALAAPSEMQISDAGLEKIKGWEGFSPTAFVDGGQWTIGYGNACDPADYPDGITEEEASELLETTIVDFEGYLNEFLAMNDITVTQNQFDALTSMTYNLGPTWLNSSYRFWIMMKDGLEHYTPSEIASALGIWCHVGTSIHIGVLQRRIGEIRIFLYGDYTETASPKFHYLIFDANGGEADTDVYVYEAGTTYGTFPSVYREGYRLVGWFTEPEGGREVTTSDVAEHDDTIYAQWAPETTTSAPTYSDVTADHWYSPYVTELSSQGIIGGYADGTFRPENTVTIGESLKLILLAAGYPPQASTDSHWASGYQSLAVSQQMATTEELSSLDEPISRQLVAKLVCNAMGLQPYTGSSVFADTDDSYVMALYTAGILDGSMDADGNRNYYPERSLNRAEVAKIIYAMEEHAGH